MSAIDDLRAMYVTEEELAAFFNVDTKRIRDLRSGHVNGKYEFIDHIKPTSKCILYQRDDVTKFLDKQLSYFFGIHEEEVK